VLLLLPAQPQLLLLVPRSGMHLLLLLLPDLLGLMVLLPVYLQRSIAAAEELQPCECEQTRCQERSIHQ
jgi:hypothetical protein